MADIEVTNVELAELLIAAFNRRDIDAFMQPTTADFA